MSRTRTRSTASAARSPHHARNWAIGVLALLGALLFSQEGGVLDPRPVEAYNVCADDNACIHEYMSDQARLVFTNDEINTFWSNLSDGVGDEDEIDHVFGLDFAGALITITHFWDADAGNGKRVPVPALFADFPNSLQKAEALWSLALGAYAQGNKGMAYHWLGHVAHLIGDHTIPTHVHEDLHGPDIFDDDSFEEWMSLADNDPNTPPTNAVLSADEIDDLMDAGPLPIPDGAGTKLERLLYITNEVADFFPSDDKEGDSNDPRGLVGPELAAMASIAKPRVSGDLADNDAIGLDGTQNNNNDGDLAVIRANTYPRGIRAIAALYQLWEETVAQPILALEVKTISEDDDDHDTFDDADYFARVTIGGFGSQNRGDNIEDDDVAPNWVFGRTVGISGSVPVNLQVFDSDAEWDAVVTLDGADDESDIDPTGDEGDLSLDMNVDLAMCLNKQPGAITGEASGDCGATLSSTGDADDEASRVGFRIFYSKSPPTADAGGPYTTDEGTDVALDGTGSTDPDNDITTYAWDLDGDGACDDVANDSTPDFTTVGQDGVTNIKLCVTDAVGLTDEDTTTVTVNNVAPTITLNSDSPNDEGSLTTVTGTISDPGWLDTLTGTIAWGDGTGTAGIVGTLENNRPDATLTFTVTHTYGDNGTFTAQVCAQDDDSAPCQNIVLQSDNVPPTSAISMAGAASVNGVPTFILHAGELLELDGRSTDPGSDDLTLGWDWGDGSVGPSTVYLVNPPLLDPAVSPSVQPRDITESQSHTYAEACAYVITFSAGDDDGGASEATANVIIVGNGKNPSGDGYWRHQFRTYLTGQGKPDFTAAELTCYLEIIGYMSSVFDEARLASTFAQAEDVLFTNGPTTMAEQFDKNLLTAWLNFADGTIEYDMMLDLDKDGTPETTFLAAVAAAEAVRLDPTSTEDELQAQKNFLGSLH